VWFFLRVRFDESVLLASVAAIRIPLFNDVVGLDDAAVHERLQAVANFCAGEHSLIDFG